MGKNKEDLYNKFPAVFKQKLIDGETSFPFGTEFEYDDIPAYRGVVRKGNDKRPFNRDDMLSHMEKGKPIPRGMAPNDPRLYAVSINKTKEGLVEALKFPKRGWKTAFGIVSQDGGPQLTTESTGHISWWLYENVNLNSFVVEQSGDYDE